MCILLAMATRCIGRVTHFMKHYWQLVPIDFSLLEFFTRFEMDICGVVTPEFLCRHSCVSVIPEVGCLEPELQ